MKSTDVSRQEPSFTKQRGIAKQTHYRLWGFYVETWLNFNLIFTNCLLYIKGKKKCVSM